MDNTQQGLKNNLNNFNHKNYSKFKDFHPCTKIGLILIIAFSILATIGIPIIFIYILSLFLVAHSFLNNFPFGNSGFNPSWIFLVIAIIFLTIFLTIYIIGLVWSIKIVRGKKPLGVGFLTYSFFVGFIIGWILLLIGWSIDHKNKTNLSFLNDQTISNE